MAKTTITTEMALLGTQQFVAGFAQTDAALVKTTESSRKLAETQNDQAAALRKLRDAERDEQQQLKQAKSIVDGTRTAEEKHQKSIEALRLAKSRGVITQEEFNRGLTASEKNLKSVESSGDRATKTLGKLAVGLGAVGLASSALRSVLNTTREFENRVDNITGDVGFLKTKLQIQGGLTDEETTQQVGTIRNVLDQLPVTDVAGAIAAQTEATSVGFLPEDIKDGSALRTILRLNAATNQFGPGADTSKTKQTIAAAGSVLAAGGDRLSAANLERLGGKFTNLFAETPVQSQDLPQLAEITATLQALGIGEDERLGSFATATQLLGANKGATALKQAATFLRSSTGKSDKLAADFGLDTTGFDLIGEGLADSLENLTQQLAPLDEATRSQAVERIFGKEAGANFLTLSGNLQSIRRNTALAGGNTFQRNVDLFQASESARNIRTLNLEAFQAVELDEDRGGLSFQELRQREAVRLAVAQRKSSGVVERTLMSGAAAVTGGIISGGELLGFTPEQVATGVGLSDSQTDAFRVSTSRPATPLQSAAGAFEAFDGPRMVELLEVIATGVERDDDKPFVPEAGTSPNPTVLLSGESGR